MTPARRLKRNLRRLLIPVETVLLWVAGPLALVFYWLWHGARLAAGAARLRR